MLQRHIFFRPNASGFKLHTDLLLLFYKFLVSLTRRIIDLQKLKRRLVMSSFKESLAFYFKGHTHKKSVTRVIYNLNKRTIAWLNSDLAPGCAMTTEKTTCLLDLNCGVVGSTGIFKKMAMSFCSAVSHHSRITRCPLTRWNQWDFRMVLFKICLTVFL